jgi:hypothetical protein
MPTLATVRLVLSLLRTSLGQAQPEAAARFGPRFETAGYQLDFKPANFSIGNHHIYAYAVSSITVAASRTPTPSPTETGFSGFDHRKRSP